MQDDDVIPSDDQEGDERIPPQLMTEEDQIPSDKK